MFGGSPLPKTLQIKISPAPKTPSIVKFLQLDLNDLAAVKRSAASFAALEPKLHILWNNAGTGANNVEIGDRTANDLDPMIGANCVATLFFTNLLHPQLKAAATESSRVVWTASYLAEGASPTNGIDMTLLDKGTTDRTKNYAISKAGTWMIGREFARRYGKDGIISVIQNPGNLRAGGYDKVPAYIMFFIGPVLHDPKFGGYTELYAGLSNDIGLENNGAYVIPWGRIRTDDKCPRKDMLKAMAPEEEGGLGYGKKLWEFSEEKWKPFL